MDPVSPPPIESNENVSTLSVRQISCIMHNFSKGPHSYWRASEKTILAVSQGYSIKSSRLEFVNVLGGSQKAIYC